MANPHTIEFYNRSSIFKPEVGDFFFVSQYSGQIISYLTLNNGTYSYSTAITKANLFRSKEDIPFKGLKEYYLLQVKDVFEPVYKIHTDNFSRIKSLEIHWRVKEDKTLEVTNNVHYETNDLTLAEAKLRELKVDLMENLTRDYLKLKQFKFENITN